MCLILTFNILPFFSDILAETFLSGLGTTVANALVAVIEKLEEVDLALARSLGYQLGVLAGRAAHSAV